MTDFRNVAGIVALLAIAGCDKPWCKDGTEVVIDLVLRVQVDDQGEPCYDYSEVVGQCANWRETQENRFGQVPGDTFTFTEAATGDCIALYGGRPEIVDGTQFLDCSESTFAGCCEFLPGERCVDGP